MHREFENKTNRSAVLGLIFAILTFVGCIKPALTPKFVTPENAQSLIARGTLVLDVRTPAEYASGHIRAARNISIDAPDFAATAATLDRKASYIVHCSANVPKGRTDRALEQLRALGMENLISMTGGIVAWKEKGFPVE